MASSAMKTIGVESEEPDRGNPRRNGRRRSKASSEAAAAQKKKKMPQRGMGVAELERLRLQERQYQASPTTNTHYFLTPFSSDPVLPVGAPVKFPLNTYNGSGGGGFRQTGCNPNGVVVPWHYQNQNHINGISKDHHHHQIRGGGSACFPDLCGFCVKKKRTNDMDFGWNKSLKDGYDAGSMNKERMDERGDLVMHQFFPTGKKDNNVKVRMELGLEASSTAAETAATVTAAAGSDIDVMFLKSINSVDLSLKL